MSLEKLQLEQGPKKVVLKGKQALFAQSKARYPAMFGGYASGKTTVGCLVGIDICLKFPGVVGAVVRNTYPELRTSTKKVFMDVLHQMDRGRSPNQRIIESENEQYNWVKFTNGSTVFFLHTQSEALFKGPEFGWFFIDQAEEMDEEQAQRITTRLRQPGYPQKGMFVGNTDKGHNWCYRWFKLKKKTNVELFEISFVDNRDNLDPYYFDEMMAYPEDWKAVNLYGSWDSPGGLVIEPLEEHMIEPFDPPEKWTRMIILDPAESTGTTAAIKAALDYDGNFYICGEYYKERKIVRDHAAGVLQLWDGKHSVIYADPNSWRKSQMGETGFVTIADRYRDSGLVAIPAANDYMASIDILRELHARTPGHKHPITGYSPAPQIYFFNRGLHNFNEELRSWMITEPDKEPCHLMDCLRYLVGSRVRKPRRPMLSRKKSGRNNFMAA